MRPVFPLECSQTVSVRTGVIFFFFHGPEVVEKIRFVVQLSCLSTTKMEVVFV